MTEYLRGHPYAFFPAQKAPHYWANDLPGLRKQAGVVTEQAYLALFRPCARRHQVIGEGSTLYLASDSAVERILDFNPTAKFVAMLRQPVDLAYSFFRQLQRSADEDQSEFETAWALQENRSRRKSIPARCCERRLLQYREIAMLGRQVDRAMQVVPPEQLHLVYYEDFNRQPRDAYRSVVSFLDLPDDDRREFPHQEMKRVRPPFVRGVMRAPLARRFYGGVKNKLSGRLVTAVRDSVLTRPADDAPVRAVFRNKLIDEYADDIRLLADRTGRNLDHWLAHQSV